MLGISILGSLTFNTMLGVPSYNFRKIYLKTKNPILVIKAPIMTGVETWLWHQYVPILWFPSLVVRPYCESSRRLCKPECMCHARNDSLPIMESFVARLRRQHARTGSDLSFGFCVGARKPA